LGQGEELCAIARLGPETDLPKAVTLTGAIDGRPYRQVVPVKEKEVAPRADYLPRTWARLEIERLLAEDAGKHKAEIVALSKAMYVMTPFTSLLVLENDQMYKDHKVDRGRKDHWALYNCPKEVPVVYEPDPSQPGDPRAVARNKPTAEQVLQTV